MINNYIDFRKLSEIVYENKRFSPDDKKLWSRISEDNKLADGELKAFIDLFVKIYDKVTKARVQYHTRMRYSHTDYDIVIDDDFARALYLNKYTHSQF